MGQCAHCRTRKGKRFCPAYADAICPLCCGRHRMVDIACPEDCVYLSQGEQYQMAKREERSLSRGQEYLEVRREQFERPEETGWAVDAECAVYLASLDDPRLTDRDVIEALESYRLQHTGLSIVGADESGLGATIARRHKRLLNMDGGAPSISESRCNEILAAVIASARRRSEESFRSDRAYLDFITTYFREAITDRLRKIIDTEDTEPSSSIVLPD